MNISYQTTIISLIHKTNRRDHLVFASTKLSSSSRIHIPTPTGLREESNKTDITLGPLVWAGFFTLYAAAATIAAEN